MKKLGSMQILPGIFLVVSCCQLWNYIGPIDGYSLDDGKKIHPKHGSTPIMQRSPTGLLIKKTVMRLQTFQEMATMPGVFRIRCLLQAEK